MFLVVGTGFSGAVIANLIATKLNEKVIIIDKRNHIGGNSYDYIDDNGITVHKYGSHIFHTNDTEVWRFLNKYGKFNQYMHKVVAVVEGIKTTIPFNFNSINDVFPKIFAEELEKLLIDKFQLGTKINILDLLNNENKILDFFSNYVYQNVFLEYTLKQWGVKPSELDNFVTARVPVYLSKDNRYFQDKYQGVALPDINYNCSSNGGGYSNIINNLLNHENIITLLNTNYKDITDTFEAIFYTGSIDEFFDYEFGVLPYRSVYFEFEEYNIPYYQENAVVNYPNNYDFTRIHEYKHYLSIPSDKTIIAKEYSEEFKLGKNDRYYPIPTRENKELYNKYLRKAKNIKNLYFLGRLGDYQYYNMDQAVKRAFDVFKNVFGEEI